MVTDPVKLGDAGREVSARVTFLRDEAAIDDFFGSHSRVAEAVATTIRDGDKPGVIGLVGPWGSGKSTVVGLVAKALAASHRVFIYDAWLHQSDPTRRSFLDQFLAFLTAEGLIGDGESWKEPFDRINRRLEVTKTTTSPHLSNGGRILLISMLGVLFGSRFVGVDWAKQTLSKRWDEPEAWVFVAGMLLTFAPILVGFVLWLFSRRHDDEEGERQSILDLVISKQVKSETSRVEKTPEPTTLEFQELFRDLLASPKLSDARVVIVVDNLDRLAAPQALEMWDTIRSFFLGALPARARPSTTNMPTVLLPVDPDGISPQINTGADARAGHLQSFMDKTFDVIFHVSVPVISDWQEYLRKALRRSLGDEIADLWGLEVVRIYSRRAAVRITPRDLNKRVNAISALWLQWRDADVPFPLVAYYSLYRSEIEADLLKGLGAPLYDLSMYDEWQESLAAIHFGVPKEDALQVLLGPKLEQVIDDVDHHAFEQMLSLSGIYQLMTAVLEQEKVDLTKARKVAELLRVGKIPQDWSRDLFALLGRIWKRSTLAEASNEQAEAHILFRILLQKLPASEADAVAGRLAREIGSWRRPEAIIRGLSPSNTSFVNLIEVWMDWSNSNDSYEPIIIQDASLYLSAAMKFHEKPALGELMVFGRGSEELAFVVERSLNDQDADVSEVLAQLSFVIPMGIGAGMRQRIFLVAEGIIESGRASLPRLDAALHALGLLRRYDEVAATWLSERARSGELAGELKANVGHWYQLPALRLLSLLVLEEADLPTAQNEAWCDIEQLEQSDARVVDTFIREYGDVPLATFARYGRDRVSRAIVAKLIGERIDAHDLGDVDPFDVVERFRQYDTIIPHERGADFLALVADDDEFWKALDNAGLTVSSAMIYKTLILDPQGSHRSATRARSQLATTLSHQPVSWWRDQIASSDAQHPLMPTLHAATRGMEIEATNVFDALSAELDDLLATADDRRIGSWFATAWLLPTQQRVEISQELVRRITAAPLVETKLSVLRAGGDEFLDLVEWDAMADLKITGILVPFLDDSRGMLWLEGHEARISGWVGHASAAAALILKEEAKRKPDELTDALRDRRSDFLGRLGLVG